MDVPGVRGLRKELDVLRELCMIPAGRHVVMNFADPKGGLSVRDVETTIGTGVDVVLPRSSAVPASTNQGVPLLQTGGKRDPMAKELQPAGVPLRGDPADEAGPLPGQAPGGAAMNLADRLAAAARAVPGARRAGAASGGRPPCPVPRPAVDAGRAAAARPTPSPGSRTASARRCSSAWAAG